MHSFVNHYESNYLHENKDLKLLILSLKSCYEKNWQNYKADINFKFDLQLTYFEAASETLV